MEVYDGRPTVVQHLNASVLADFVKGSADVGPRMRVGRKTYVTEYFHFAVRVESSGSRIQPVCIFANCNSVYLRF